MKRERERELWHGILFEEPNPEREPPTRPNWALESLEDDDTDDTGNPTPPKHKEVQGGQGKPNRQKGAVYSRAKPSTCVQGNPCTELGVTR